MQGGDVRVKARVRVGIRARDNIKLRSGGDKRVRGATNYNTKYILNSPVVLCGDHPLLRLCAQLFLQIVHLGFQGG